MLRPVVSPEDVNRMRLFRDQEMKRMINYSQLWATLDVEHPTTQAAMLKIKSADPFSLIVFMDNELPYLPRVMSDTSGSQVAFRAAGQPPQGLFSAPIRMNNATTAFGPRTARRVSAPSRYSKTFNQSNSGHRSYPIKRVNSIVCDAKTLKAVGIDGNKNTAESSSSAAMEPVLQDQGTAKNADQPGPVLTTSDLALSLDANARQEVGEHQALDKKMKKKSQKKDKGESAPESSIVNKEKSLYSNSIGDSGEMKIETEISSDTVTIKKDTVAMENNSVAVQSEVTAEHIPTDVVQESRVWQFNASAQPFKPVPKGLTSKAPISSRAASEPPTSQDYRSTKEVSGYTGSSQETSKRQMTTNNVTTAFGQETTIRVLAPIGYSKPFHQVNTDPRNMIRLHQSFKFQDDSPDQTYGTYESGYRSYPIEGVDFNVRDGPTSEPTEIEENMNTSESSVALESVFQGQEVVKDADQTVPVLTKSDLPIPHDAHTDQKEEVHPTLDMKQKKKKSQKKEKGELTSVRFVQNNKKSVNSESVANISIMDVENHITSDTVIAKNNSAASKDNSVTVQSGVATIIPVGVSPSSIQSDGDIQNHKESSSVVEMVVVDTVLKSKEHMDVFQVAEHPTATTEDANPVQIATTVDAVTPESSGNNLQTTISGHAIESSLESVPTDAKNDKAPKEKKVQHEKEINFSMSVPTVEEFPSLPSSAEQSVSQISPDNLEKHIEMNKFGDSNQTGVSFSNVARSWKKTESICSKSSFTDNDIVNIKKEKKSSSPPVKSVVKVSDILENAGILEKSTASQKPVTLTCQKTLYSPKTQDGKKNVQKTLPKKEAVIKKSYSPQNKKKFIPTPPKPVRHNPPKQKEIDEDGFEIVTKGAPVQSVSTTKYVRKFEELAIEDEITPEKVVSVPSSSSPSTSSSQKKMVMKMDEKENAKKVKVLKEKEKANLNGNSVVERDYDEHSNLQETSMDQKTTEKDETNVASQEFNPKETSEENNSVDESVSSLTHNDADDNKKIISGTVPMEINDNEEGILTISETGETSNLQGAPNDEEMEKMELSQGVELTEALNMSFVEDPVSSENLDAMDNSETPSSTAESYQKESRRMKKNKAKGNKKARKRAAKGVSPNLEPEEQPGGPIKDSVWEGDDAVEDPIEDAQDHNESISESVIGSNAIEDDVPSNSESGASSSLQGTQNVETNPTTQKSEIEMMPLMQMRRRVLVNEGPVDQSTSGSSHEETGDFNESLSSYATAHHFDLEAMIAYCERRASETAIDRAADAVVNASNFIRIHQRINRIETGDLFTLPQIHFKVIAKRLKMIHKNPKKFMKEQPMLPFMQIDPDIQQCLLKNKMFLTQRLEEIREDGTPYSGLRMLVYVAFRAELFEPAKKAISWLESRRHQAEIVFSKDEKSLMRALFTQDHILQCYF